MTDYLFPEKPDGQGWLLAAGRQRCRTLL